MPLSIQKVLFDALISNEMILPAVSIIPVNIFYRILVNFIFMRRNFYILEYSFYLCVPKNNFLKLLHMLIIDSKDCENIDKALKKYKKKFEKSKVLLQLRERQAFIKPSIRRRGQVLKAVYRQQIASGKIDE